MTVEETFDTPRLYLRPRQIADLKACLAMDRDPEVTRFVSGPWADPIAHETFVRQRMTRDYGPGLGYWSVFEREKPEIFIGWVLLIPEDTIGPDVEIGWRFRRDAWGKGYASEAATALCRHAFESLKLDHVVAEIDAGNRGSLRVAEKLGMIRVPAKADASATTRVMLSSGDWLRA